MRTANIRFSETKRSGVLITEMSEHIRKEAWERFENLERGLMSNGVAWPDRRL
jgi:hypothetical protein